MYSYSNTLRMILLPFEKLILYTDLKKSDIALRLIEYLEPAHSFKYYWRQNSPKLYVGKITEKGFGIRRIFKRQNSFIPFVNGIIEENPTGCIITVIMHLHYIVLLPLSLMICFLIYAIFRYHEISLIVFLLMIYLMTISFFNIETSRTKKDLQLFFNAIIQPKTIKAQLKNKS